MDHGGCCRLFPADVWFEILLRVRPENLTKLKRVCKCWHDLITDRDFKEMHRDRHLSRIARFVFSRYGSRLYYLSFGVDDNHRAKVWLSRLRSVVVDELESGIHLHDSYDGLLLISPGDSYRFILYSLVTRTYESLPDYDRGCNFWDWKIVRDESIDRYTVVGLCTEAFESEDAGQPDSTAKCLVLDRSNCSWKALKPPRGTTGSIEVRGTRSDGMIHWLITHHYGDQSDLLRTSLLSFEPAKQRFRIRPCSHMPTTDRSMEQIFEYDGTFYRTCRYSYKFTELWVLTDLGGPRPMWMEGQKIEKHHFSFYDLKVLAVLEGYNKWIMISWPTFRIALYGMNPRRWTLTDVDDDEESNEDEESGIPCISAILPVK